MDSPILGLVAESDDTVVSQALEFLLWDMEPRRLADLSTILDASTLQEAVFK